ncbi:MAG: SpoIIE family protein phosphatase [Gemmataceae bacterium]|nr:SpoIIE family protein phosphatase [Gemmataceae bacterium]
MMISTPVPVELTLRSVMTPEPLVVGPDTPIRDAARQMNSRRVGAILIADSTGLIGIFSERDLLRLAAGDEPGWQDRPLHSVMTRNPYRIGPEAGWEDAVTLMETHRVRHLPVVEGERVIGIVSSRQLMARRTDHLNQLVDRRTYELSERDRILQHQLRLAGGLLERALLPQQPPGGPDLAWAVRYLPLDSLGGDYYDFVTTRKNMLGVLIADAAGHSVAAAMVAVMARIAFAEAAREVTRPAEVLAQMNDRLTGFNGERFVTAFYARLDRPARRMICANAGHPRPIHYSARTGQCEPIGPTGLPLGVTDSVAYTESMVELDPGDRLVFFTDGVTDANNPKGESFGTRRLAAVVADGAHDDAQQLLERIKKELTTFRAGTANEDDITILVGEVR